MFFGIGIASWYTIRIPTNYNAHLAQLHIYYNFNAVVASIREKYSPYLLSERKENLVWFSIQKSRPTEPHRGQLKHAQWKSSLRDFESVASGPALFFAKASQAVFQLVVFHHHFVDLIFHFPMHSTFSSQVILLNNIMV
jgi:hypothetical protein